MAGLIPIFKLGSYIFKLGSIFRACDGSLPKGNPKSKMSEPGVYYLEVHDT